MDRDARPTAFEASGRRGGADDGVRKVEAFAELNGLGEVPSRDPDVVAFADKALRDRPHDEYVGAVCQVDPDAHGNATLASIAAGAAVDAGIVRSIMLIASISEAIVNETAHFVAEAGLPGIFALMAISSMCIPIPSEVVMLFGGFIVADPAAAHSSHELTLVGVVLAGLAGTLVGSWIAYAVGRAGRLELFNGTATSFTWGPRSWTRRIAGSRTAASSR